MRKNRKLIRTLALSLAAISALANITPVYAANSEGKVNATQTVSDEENAKCEVYAMIGNYFSVIIPKKLTLDGTTKKGAYTVKVEGDIGGTDTIKVVPEETFTLTSTGLADQTAQVSQDKTEWNSTEIFGENKVIGNGSISANGITAGSWNGSFWFNINMEEGIVEPEPELEIQVDGNTTDNIAIGTGDTVQLDVFVDSENKTSEAEWSSDNPHITVDDGLVRPSSSAQTGETANITVTIGENSVSVKVTLIDIILKKNNVEVETIDVKKGESFVIDATIIPSTIKNSVTWTTTAQSGVKLSKYGNSVTVQVADDIPSSMKMLIASYGSYSKVLVMNITD